MNEIIKWALTTVLPAVFERVKTAILKPKTKTVGVWTLPHHWRSHANSNGTWTEVEDPRCFYCGVRRSQAGPKCVPDGWTAAE